MSRYLILLMLNTPLVIAGLLNTLLTYKLKQINYRQFVLRMVLWLFVLAGLIFAQFIYNFLFSNHLTETEPLSLFDVIQITGIVFILLMASRTYTRVDILEQRLQQLHQDTSIHLSEPLRNPSETKARKIMSK